MLAGLFIVHRSITFVNIVTDAACVVVAFIRHIGIITAPYLRAVFLWVGVCSERSI